MPPRGGLFRYTPPLPFSVYLKSQNVLADTAPHTASRLLAKLIIASRLARRVGQNSLQLTTDEPWGSIKLRARGQSRKVPIPLLLAPLDFYLPANYPLPYSLLRHYERARV